MRPMIAIRTKDEASRDGERSGEAGMRAAVRVDRAHDADSVTVWVLHDCVAGSPECIVRRLLADVSEGSQFGVQAVDSFSTGDFEADDGASRTPADVPMPGELRAVEVEIDTAREAGASVVDLKCGIGVSDVQSKSAVEGHGGSHVRNDEAQLVKIRAVVHSNLLPPGLAIRERAA